MTPENLQELYLPSPSITHLLYKEVLRVARLMRMVHVVCSMLSSDSRRQPADDFPHLWNVDFYQASRDNSAGGYYYMQQAIDQSFRQRGCDPAVYSLK